MITKMHVRNFKSLKDVSLALGPINVLAGPNMGGKSNVLDAFYFLQQFLFPQSGTEGLYFALAQRGGIAEVLWKGEGESLIGFHIEATWNEKKWEYDLEIIAGTGGFAQIQREGLALRTEGGAIPLIIPDGGTRWLANLKGEKLMSYSTASRSAMENAPDNWDGADFARIIRLWKFYQFVPQAMKQQNPTGSGQVLERVGQNLSAWLLTLQTRFPQNFGKLVQVARDAFPELTSLHTHPTAQGTVFLSSNERGLARPVTVTQMSDGELAFLALLSLLFAPAELAATAYFIEELETHLHPSLLSSLVRLTRQVRDEISGEGKPLAQLFVTTQSPQLVDEMSLDEILWVGKKDGQTYAIRPNDNDHLRKLVADRDLGLGDVVYSGLLSERR